MITISNISDIRLLSQQAYEILTSWMGRSTRVYDPQTNTSAYLDHNIACFKYRSFEDTKHLWILVTYGDQTWLDVLAQRFPSHKLRYVEHRDYAWVYVEKTEETPDWVSSRILHALRFLTSEFADARLKTGNPPTTWKELFQLCFRFATFKYHLPWSTENAFWKYLFIPVGEYHLEEYGYYELWEPTPKDIYYETIDYLSEAVWDCYHIGNKNVKSVSSWLLHKDTVYSTMLPMKKIIARAAAKRLAALTAKEENV